MIVIFRCVEEEIDIFHLGYSMATYLRIASLYRGGGPLSKEESASRDKVRILEEIKIFGRNSMTPEGRT